MKTFVSELRVGRIRIEGIRIHANTWDEAKSQAEAIGVDLIGLLQEEHIYYPV